MLLALVVALIPVSSFANYRGVSSAVPGKAAPNALTTSRPVGRSTATVPTPARTMKLKANDQASTQHQALNVQASEPVMNPAAGNQFTSAGGSSYTGAAGKAVAQFAPPLPAVPGFVMPPTSQDPNMLPTVLQMAGQILPKLFGGADDDTSADEDDDDGDLTGNDSTGTTYDQDSDMRSLIETTGKIQGRVDDMGGPPSHSAPCVLCSTETSQNPLFETCTQRNGYFEDLLEAANNPRLALLKEHTPKDSTVSCIAQTMRNVSTPRYHECPSGVGRYGPRVKRPCASERYVRAVASAYEMTSDCFSGYLDSRADSDPDAKASIRRALFQLVNHESGWVTNAVSGTEAGGMGQFTSGAIASVNTMHFQQMQDYMRRNTGNASCQTLAKGNYERMPKAPGCARLSLENGNPQLGLMYTMAHMKMVRDAVETTVDGLNLSSSVRSQLIDQLMIWGHNVGTGISQMFRTAARRHGAMLRAGNVDGFLDTMKGDVRAWHRTKAGKGRVSEATNFLAHTQARMDNLEKRMNGSCGVLR